MAWCSRRGRIADRISRDSGGCEAAHPLPRQPNRRSRSGAELAAQSQLAAMCLNQGLGNGQAQTGTLMFACQMIGNLLERFEDSFELPWWDADPRISDRQHQFSAFAERHIDVYTTSRICKLNRI